MADKHYQFLSQPGVLRDGTNLESNFYTDSEWVRWQRGKPRKMGGYRAMSQLANGPVRSLLVDSRNGLNTTHYFSQWGIQRQQFSSSGAGGGLENRTPAGFVPDNRFTWSQGIMTSSSGGSYSALLAASSPDLDQLDSDLPGRLYQGNMADSLPLQVVSDTAGQIQVSGGVCVLQPFAVVYGSNGLIKNSSPNDFTPAGWDTTVSGTFANEANVAGTKFIYGAPIRGGSQSPAGLFWAIDALVRMSFVGGANVWQYDTLSQPTSIMSKKGIVEHDGKFFWPGTDRFLMYNGVVQELPNQMNCNWFFDNLNYAARNKVWGTKIPRWGEIWWFYPRDADTECGHAVIWNYIENTWYDAVKTRSAGGQVQLFPFPVWAGAEDSMQTTVLTVGLRLVNSVQTALGNATITFTSTTGVVDGQQVFGQGVAPGTTVVSHTATTVVMSNVSTAIIAAGSEITFSSMAIPFLAGQIVVGGTSGARGTVVRTTQTNVNLVNVTGTFLPAENLASTTTAAAGVSSAAPFTQQLDSAYQHETGVNKIVGDSITAIRASFTSKQFGFAFGNPFMDAPTTDNVMTRIGRMDLDFSQVGDLEFQVLGRSFPQETNRVLQTKVAQSSSTEFVEFRAQERILSVRVTSNERDGFFEQGQVMFALEPGDQRSSKKT